MFIKLAEREVMEWNNFLHYAQVNALNFYDNYVYAQKADTL